MKLKHLWTLLLLILTTWTAWAVNIVSDVTDVISIGTKITAESQLVSGKPYLLRNTATGNPWITDAGTYYSVGNNGGTFDDYCIYYLIQDGDKWKLMNYKTGKYWGTPTAASTDNQGGFVPTDEAGAGSWSLNFNASGNINPQCNGFYINRSSQKLHGWTSSLSSQIYEVVLTAAPFSEFEDKDISVGSEAASLQTGKWYVMFDRGANHGYLYENGENKLYNTNTVPAGSATDNAKYLVRIVGWNNEYYLQTGRGNFFGNIQHSTNVPTTTTPTEQITIKKINGTDGHFYLMSQEGVVLDANDLTNGDGTVVGWGTTVPTTTGGNNDWAFYPVEFVNSWVPTINEVYTINNTNTSRGAMMYNAASNYVWSSGKSGTFSATDPNCQWVLVPTGTDDQYYLYNIGAGKFAIPSGTTSTASWVFSPNAVAVTLLKQNDGTFKIKTATTDTYAAVSNGFNGPIINYNDVGGNFTITKVNGNASVAANAAIAKLVKNQTALTGAVTADDGWYVIRIKTTSNSTATSTPGRYVYQGTTNQANYPLTFTGGIDVQPAISDVTFYTRFVKNGTDYNWQMTNGKYLVNNNNVFPTPSSEPRAIVPGYDNGNYIKSNGRFADPYVSSGNFFIGETASYRTTWSIYPIDLTTAGLVAWQVICNAAPESAQITCSRADVVGQNAVYKNGFFFFPAGVTPEESDFVLEGANGVTIDATAHTITLAYDPNLAMVEGSVIVAQGWQTAGRDSEVMLLKFTASPFKAATGVTLTVNLKDGSENHISSLKLYEASTSSPEIYSTGSDAPTKTEVATASISGSTATFSIGNLSVGSHYYWIGATVSSTATLGAVLDAAVTNITYTCNENVTNLDLTSVGDPSDRGAMVFNVRSYPFLPRDNGSRVYRIPAMVVADDGSIVVAADKRYNSHTDIGNGGHVIDIVVRRSTDGGRTWSEPVTIAKGEGSTASGGADKRCGYGDPSLVKGKDGKLYCLFAAGNEGYFYGQKGMCMSVSTDNGVTWSSGVGNPPVDLYWSGAIKNVATAGAAGFGLYDYFVTSGRGLYIPDDDILMYLIPAQTMTSATEHTGDSQDYIFYSRDGGESWYFSNIPMVQGGDEAKIIQMNDGSLFGSIRKGGQRRFNTATYTCNDDGKTLNFNFGTQWDNSQLTQSSQNNQDILYYQRETVTGKKDYIFHSITTGNHTNFKLYYSTDQGNNWTEFLNVQTKGTRYVTMDKSGTDENPGSLYLFFEDQSLNSAGGYTDYNHYPLNFIEITREQLLQYIPDLDKSAMEKEVKIVEGTTGYNTYGNYSGGWISSWVSNANSGLAGLTMATGTPIFNSYSNWQNHYNICVRPTNANTNYVITLTAPDGYFIQGYELKARLGSSTLGEYATVTAADGSSFQPATNAFTPFEVNGLLSKSTTITVNSTEAGKDVNIVDFKVYLVKTFDITLNETADMAAVIANKDGKPANVTMNRTIVAGFNTVAVPFDLTAEQVQAVFGEGTKVYAYSENSDDPNEATINFNLVTEGTITANVPVLVEATAASTTKTIENVIIKNDTPVATGKYINFEGVYAPTTVAAGDYFVANDAIYKSTGATNMKAFRAFLNAKEAVGNVKMFIQDTQTGIQHLMLYPATAGEERIYNLAGQRLNKLQRGVNIVNGKKVIVK